MGTGPFRFVGALEDEVLAEPTGFGWDMEPVAVPSRFNDH